MRAGRPRPSCASRRNTPESKRAGGGRRVSVRGGRTGGSRGRARAGPGQRGAGGGGAGCGSSPCASGRAGMSVNTHLNPSTCSQWAWRHGSRETGGSQQREDTRDPATLRRREPLRAAGRRTPAPLQAQPGTRTALRLSPLTSESVTSEIPAPSEGADLEAARAQPPRRASSAPCPSPFRTKKTQGFETSPNHNPVAERQKGTGQPAPSLYFDTTS